MWNGNRKRRCHTEYGSIRAMRLAVLLSVHNRKRMTLKCLGNLQSQKLPFYLKLTVFLVDDGSTDGTSAAVKAQFPNTVLLEGNGSLYWNGGMRMAWANAAKSDFDYYLWLNDDVELYPDSVRRMVELHTSLSSKAKDRRKIVVGTCVDPETKVPSYGGRTLSAEIIYSERKAKECTIFNGNFVLIPKEVFLVVGTLSPYYKHGYGDYDYGLRASKEGIASIVLPGFVGTCSHHDDAGWTNPQLSLINRWRIFHSPKGLMPGDYFRFQHRRHGMKAIKYLITAYMRMILGVQLENRKKNLLKDYEKEN